MAIDTNADFTPSIPDSGVVPTKLPYNPTGSFKFWAQKVIPLVYDDSLSYYEVLCKVVTYLNNVIQNVDNLNDSVDSTNESFETLEGYVNTTKDALINAYDELQGYVNTYFDNLDVQEEINEKLDAMADSGTLTTLLAPFIPDLVTSWLNTHVDPVGSAVVVDNTLSISGAAADAKATGDIKNALTYDEYLINNGTYTIKADDLESGQWSYSTKASNPARARTKNLLPVRAGMTITYANTTFDIYFGVLETPTSPDYIQTIGWKTDENGTINITKDGWLTFIIRNHADTTANVNPSDYDSTVIIKTVINKELRGLIDSGFIPHGALADNTDFDDISTNGFWFTNSLHTYQHCPLPSGVAGIVISYVYSANLKAQVVYSFYNEFSSMYFRHCIAGTWREWTHEFTGNGTAPNNTDLDTLIDSGMWLLDSGRTYAHSPLQTGYAATLLCFKPINNITLQIAVEVSSSAPKMYARSRISTSAMSGWTEWIVVNDGNTYNNTYETQHYENTYNITCNPTITTDTNNYLASTGDTTDRTGDIQTMLNTTGVCRLGPGRFYTTGIEIPSYGALFGSGKQTELILSGSVTNGYAVKLKTHGTVKDLYIRGATANITVSNTVGTRHGIIFEGTSDAQSSPVVYYHSYITGCTIRNFSGGAITCYNTGYSPEASIIVSDCVLENCDAGINVSYRSEFHRWTNITSQGNYYGCICNGGNNNFVNCDFSDNKQALLIDNSTGQSPNNSHGTFSACTFNHSDNVRQGGSIVSVGKAIEILGAGNGEIFTGCQIFFGGIIVDDSTGVRFIGANIGRFVPITITDSNVVTFSDSTFSEAPDNANSLFTQSGNTILKFTDCYLRNGTVYNPMP